MRRSLAVAVAGMALIAAQSQQAGAQVALGYTDVGAVIGLGGINGASAAFGGRFEKIFKKLPDLGDGLLGIGVSADVYSYDVGPGSVRYIPFGATANYHFKIDPKNKLDAFLGAGLGFQTISCSGFGTGTGCGFSSGVYFIGRAGGRYFLKPNLALYADAGAGSAAISIGVTFKLK